MLSCVWLFSDPCDPSPMDSLYARLPYPLPSPRGRSLAQTHVHWVSDTIQPFPLLSPSLSALNLSQNQELYNELALCIRCQSIGASVSALVLLMDIQDWFPLGLTGLISQFKGLSRILSNTTAHKHQFLGVQLTLWSNSHIHTWLLGKPALTRWTFAGKGLCFLICYLVLS